MILVALVLAIMPGIPMVVQAAACTFAVLVQIKPGQALNVRTTPISGSVVDTVDTTDGVIPVKNVDIVSCWFQIANPNGPSGFVSNSTQYIQVISPTPVIATVTRIPVSVTPIIPPSPTRVTPVPGIWITINGVSHFCGLSCDVHLEYRP